MSDGGEGRVGLVVAGAGARGAYEIGALSVLVPWLCARGEGPRILVGTSAGAINVVLTAAMCSMRDPTAGAELAVHAWRSIGRKQVFRTIVASGPVTVARYLATLLGLPRTEIGASLGLSSLLDPAPLRETIQDLGPWQELHSAVRSGSIDSIAVAATGFAEGGTVAFVESNDPGSLPKEDVKQRIRYRPARLGPDHAMASSAIPLAFPPVEITADPAGAAAEPGRGWYFDGGVLLNAPIKPSLALGAERLLVVATHPLPRLDGGPPRRRVPDIFDVTSAVLTATLVDRMAEDVHELDRINRLLLAGATGTGYILVPYFMVAPRTPSTIGLIADRILHEKYDGLPWLDTFDLTVITRLLGGPGEWHAELMSFLLFDPDFIEELVELGRQDAQEVLRVAGDTPFRLTQDGETPAAVHD